MANGRGVSTNYSDRVIPAGASDFGHCEFPAGANFRNAVFSGDASFVDVRANGPVDFTGARFEGRAFFQDARFDAGVILDEATFAGAAVFGPAQPRPAELDELAEFEEPVAALGAGRTLDGTRIIAISAGGAGQIVSLDGTRQPIGAPADAVVMGASRAALDPLIAYGVTGRGGFFAREVGRSVYAAGVHPQQWWVAGPSEERPLISAVQSRGRPLAAYATDAMLGVLDLGARSDIVLMPTTRDERCTAIAIGEVEEDGASFPIVAAGFSTGVVRVFYAERQARFEPATRLPHVKHDGAVTCIAILRRPPYVVSGGEDEALRQWVGRDQLAPPPIDLNSLPRALDAVARENGDHLAAIGDAGGSISIVGLSGGTYRMDPLGGHDGAITDVIFVAEDEGGVRAVSGGMDGAVRRWHVKASGGIRVNGGVSARRAIFRDDVELARFSATGPVDLSDCLIEGDLTVVEASAPAITLDRCRIRGRAELRRVRAHRGIELSGAVVTGPLHVEESAVRRVRVDNARLADGLVVAGSSIAEGITLGRARLGGPSRLSGRRDAPLPVRALAGATLEAAVTLHRVDLRRCSFGGATGLDQLVVASARFNERPERAASPRATIRDEVGWRERAPRRVRFGIVLGGGRHQRHRDVAAHIARLYRELRKAHEDFKNEPGAADFYYGEMEMRKFADRRTVRLLIAAYWLVSGYGLRPLRALTALAVVLALAALPMASGGYVTSSQAAPTYIDALLDLAQVTVSLSVAPTERFSTQGEVLSLAVRILGPVLLALAVLALRGRVKR
jgi:hypothetical protein